MSEYWLRTLKAVEAAEDEARRLRARYGDDAERRLDELTRRPTRRPEGRIDDIRRALRWT
ncbi:hypothetical protein [Phenylobacterium sp.]|jgi:hypothetical protein|uniref:hypothetical protein n=1 Tax=Phenylobacterium sp. TaxID=1871053 RepID=UPI0037848FEE